MYKLPWPGRSVDYTREDRKAVLAAMEADPQTQGVYLKEFERVFSAYHGGRHSFAVSSGAAALEIAAMLLELKPDDEVIIPAHTYCATAIPFARRGVKIVWADIDPHMRVVTAETIRPLTTDKTKAIIVVHLYGVNAPVNCINAIVDERRLYQNILVIEDCAQSLGATYEYKPEWLATHTTRGGPKIRTFTSWGRSGTHGDISIYSFHGQKNITTLGEGGMITVRDEDLAKFIPGLRHNGHRLTGDKKLVCFDLAHVYPYNFSIGEVQCAVGISQMKRLDSMNADRHNKARMIIDGLSDIEDLVFQVIPKGSTHTYHCLCARYPQRDRLIDILGKQYGIQCVIQFNPLYNYPLFAAYQDHDCPNTDKFHREALSFPFAGWYTEDQINYLRDSIRKAVYEAQQ